MLIHQANNYNHGSRPYTPQDLNCAMNGPCIADRAMIVQFSMEYPYSNKYRGRTLYREYQLVLQRSSPWMLFVHMLSPVLCNAHVNNQRHNWLSNTWLDTILLPLICWLRIPNSPYSYSDQLIGLFTPGQSMHTGYGGCTECICT